MKKIVAIAVALFASGAIAAVNGSKHDMANYTNATGSTGGNGSVCSYCHMPHNGVAITGAPLWARNVTYTQTYSYYTSDVTGALTSTPAAFQVQTRLCLSCHDGTRDVAQTFADDYNGASDTRVTGAALLGTDLRNDHPVSIVYPDAGGGPAGLAAKNAIAPFTLYNSNTTIECATCHEPHTDTTYAQYPGTQFMRNPGGDFCAICHSTK